GGCSTLILPRPLLPVRSPSAYPATNRISRFDITAEMNSGPQPALAELLRQAPVASGLAREKMAQHVRRSRAKGRRVRHVAWEVGVWDYRSDGRVELVGTRRPVVKFCVLRSDPAIVVGDMHQRVSARRARGAAVQAELSQPPTDLVTQAVKHARTPVLS